MTFSSSSMTAAEAPKTRKNRPTSRNITMNSEWIGSVLFCRQSDVDAYLVVEHVDWPAPVPPLLFLLVVQFARERAETRRILRQLT